MKSSFFNIKLNTFADFSSEQLGSPFKNNFKKYLEIYQETGKVLGCLSLQKSGNPIQFFAWSRNGRCVWVKMLRNPTEFIISHRILLQITVLDCFLTVDPWLMEDTTNCLMLLRLGNRSKWGSGRSWQYFHLSVEKLPRESEKSITTSRNGHHMWQQETLSKNSVSVDYSTPWHGTYSPHFLMS